MLFRSAQPKGIVESDPTVITLSENHGSLQANEAVLQILDGILTASSTTPREIPRGLRDDEAAFGVRVDDLSLAGQPLAVAIGGARDRPATVQLFDEAGREVASTLLARTQGDGERRTSFDDLAPGAYQVVVGSPGLASVTATTLVWGE